jgi:hypothetical protein
MKIIFILSVSFLINFQSFSQDIKSAQHLISQFKNGVGYIYIKDNNIPRAIGTGFLVSYPSKTEGKYIYIVTAKHVIESSQNIFLRFNTKDLSTYIPVSINRNGKNKNVYTHPDPSIDIAIFPIYIPETDSINTKTVPISMIIKKSQYDSLKIYIGTDVFFAGLFTTYISEKKVNPVFRFGHLSLIPDEKIGSVNEIKRDIFLIESASFGGNSGSPIYYKVVDEVATSVYLARVMLGKYHIPEDLNYNNQDVTVLSNLGISAVTPSEYILEILNLPELKKQRD